MWSGIKEIELNIDLDIVMKKVTIYHLKLFGYFIVVIAGYLFISLGMQSLR
jgi:hypothetical protein